MRQHDDSHTSELNFSGTATSAAPHTSCQRRSWPAVADRVCRTAFCAAAGVYCQPGADSDIRGEHGHFSCQQILVCIQRQIDVECRLGNEVDFIQLTPGADALWIPACIWASQTYQSQDAVLLVICSEPYSENSYFKEVF